MAAPVYRVNGGASPTTAATSRIALTSSAKTHIQLVHSSNAIRVIEWGVSFDGTTTGTPIICELIQTGSVGGTVTPYSLPNDVTQFSDPLGNAPGLNITGGTASGYNASTEGAVVAPVRTGDVQLVAPTNQYVKQFPLGQEFVVPANGVLRVRLTGSGSTPNASSYVVFSVG
jgi:hypothetical protein